MRKMNCMPLSAIFAVLLPLAGLAETFDYRFDVRLALVKIGGMQVAANNDGSSYSAGMVLYTTGLAGVFYDVRYEQSVIGRIAPDGRLQPIRHSLINDEQGRISHLEILFDGNNVSGVTYDPQRNVPEDFSGIQNVVDQMSLIYWLLRPGRSQQVCTGEIDFFDGKNVSMIKFMNVQRRGDGRVQCDIVYSGAVGKIGVALSALVFAPDTEGLMRIRRFDVNTSIGLLTAKAR
ncbi:MAG: DUF3108 domain-containing protein [Paracoccaceae bacterium]